jgi:type III secretion protein Q
VLTAARVVSFEPSDRARSGFAIEAHGTRLVLCGADARVTQHMSGLLKEIPAAIAPWAGLRVRSRLRLMVRRWTPAFLRSLAPGDVVLLGADAARQTLVVGTSFTLQVQTHMSFDAGNVEAAGEARMALDTLAESQNPGGAVEDLQLPVAFEIDTARVSLAELAGMRAGYMIELDAPLAQAAVRLVCHGQVVGHGQLMAVGEHLGVRILRMGIDHAVAARN